MSLRIFQFSVIHKVKGFSVANEAEVDVFLEFSGFFYDPTAIGNLISGNFRSPRLKDDEKRHAINLLEATSTDPHCVLFFKDPANGSLIYLQ